MIWKRSLFLFPSETYPQSRKLPGENIITTGVIFARPSVREGSYTSQWMCGVWLAASGEASLGLENPFLCVACKVLGHGSASRRWHFQQPSLVGWETTSFSISSGVAEAAWWPLQLRPQLFYDLCRQRAQTWVRSACLIHKCWRFGLVD